MNSHWHVGIALITGGVLQVSKYTDYVEAVQDFLGLLNIFGVKHNINALTTEQALYSIEFAIDEGIRVDHAIFRIAIMHCDCSSFQFAN